MSWETNLDLSGCERSHGSMTISPPLFFLAPDVLRLAVFAWYDGSHRLYRLLLLWFFVLWVRGYMGGDHLFVSSELFWTTVILVGVN